MTPPDRSNRSGQHVRVTHDENRRTLQLVFIGYAIEAPEVFQCSVCGDGTARRGCKIRNQDGGAYHLICFVCVSRMAVAVRDLR